MKRICEWNSKHWWSQEHMDYDYFEIMRLICGEIILSFIHDIWRMHRIDVTWTYDDKPNLLQVCWFNIYWIPHRRKAIQNCVLNVQCAHIVWSFLFMNICLAVEKKVAQTWSISKCSILFTIPIHNLHIHRQTRRKLIGTSLKIPLKDEQIGCAGNPFGLLHPIPVLMEQL